jgi:retron-type reverse transcriptase
LSEFWNKRFLINSYSCQPKKGAHKAIEKLDSYLKKESSNNWKTVWVLKCDIRRFFDSVDHKILLELAKRGIEDVRTIDLINRIIESFQVVTGKGIPLGNVTSQLFANIYLHELDRFVKHKMKVRFYVRYCDDFVIADKNREQLQTYVPILKEFLSKKLLLTLHPDKITFRKYRQGVDFLGYVLFPHHRVLRPRTAKRILKKLQHPNQGGLPSYLGILKHCNGHKLEKKILELSKSWKQDSFELD